MEFKTGIHSGMGINLNTYKGCSSDNNVPRSFSSFCDFSIEILPSRADFWRY